MPEKPMGCEHGQVARRVRRLVDATICVRSLAAEKSMVARSCQVPVSRPTRFSNQAMASSAKTDRQKVGNNSGNVHAG